MQISNAVVRARRENGTLKAKAQDSVSNRWPTVRLGDVCEFRRGLTYSKSDEVDSSNNVVLRSNNVDLEKSALVLSELKFINDAVEIPEDKKVVAGSILMCMANGSKSHLGKVAMIEQDFGYAFGGFMGLLVPTDNIFPKYLFSILISPRFKNLINSLMDGANINNLKFKDIADYQFPLPPLAEQRKIVAKLEKDLARVEAMRVQFERMATAAEDLFKATLAEEFAKVKGDKVRLGDVCDEMSTGPYGSALHKSDYITNGIPIVNPINICDHQIVPDGKTVSRETINRLSSYKLRMGDIVIARRGEMGRAAQVTQREEGWLCGTGSFFLRLKDCVSSEYFVQWFGSPFVVALLEKNSTGATMPNLNHAILSSLEIPLPPLAVQREIVARLDAAKARSEGIAAKAREAVATCEKLRKAILAEAFQ